MAVNKIDLTIEEGEFIAISGKSGAGKSTLLHMLGCIDAVSSGTYRLDGKDISKYRDSKLSEIRNTYFGFVLQDFALINEMTTAENIFLPALFHKSSFKNIGDRTEQLLKQVGLHNQMNKKVKYMSGGERQRVAIARALINNPHVILADEPTGNLDSETSKEIVQILKELNRQGKTIIIVTHDLEIAAECKRIIKIHDGRILEDVTNEKDMGQLVMAHG
jgi:ABC-type lipoprotein export system ATPase subunit